jgi:hypothetical protein
MSIARFQIINETTIPIENGFTLCLQWGEYQYRDGFVQTGYRFIHRSPKGSLVSARGQARIPSFAQMQKLVDQAKAEGWGDLVSDSWNTKVSDPRQLTPELRAAALDLLRAGRKAPQVAHLLHVRRQSIAALKSHVTRGNIA